MTKQTRKKDLTIRCWDWQVNHHVCKSISINNRFAVQLYRLPETTALEMPSVRLTLHFVHGWRMILHLKQPQFPTRGFREGCTHRISHSYLTSMVSTHHAKYLLTFSTPSLDVSVKLLSIVTLEFCLNTALLQSLYSIGLSQWDLLFGSCADSHVTTNESLPLVHPRQTPLPEGFHQVEVV